jgi:predicted amidophosphoribosyltransferase
MSEIERERGWCNNCGRAEYSHESAPPDVLICPGCGEEMKSLDALTREESSTLAFQDWMEQVHVSGKMGPSPGGAVAKLKCDRSMIDKLADRGILEKSVYDRDGHYVVIISSRSIAKAKENKEKRKKWTDSGED